MVGSARSAPLESFGTLRPRTRFVSSYTKTLELNSMRCVSSPRLPPSPSATDGQAGGARMVPPEADRERGAFTLSLPNVPTRRASGFFFARAFRSPPAGGSRAVGFILTQNQFILIPNPHPPGSKRMAATPSSFAGPVRAGLAGVFLFLTSPTVSSKILLDLEYQLTAAEPPLFWRPKDAKYYKCRIWKLCSYYQI